MTYKLFIDDERFPVDNSFVICRNLDEVMATIMELGAPHFISFDHDLGENIPTGMDIAKVLVEMDLDGKIDLNSEFTFYVHSQNVAGAANIQSYLSNYLKVKRNEHLNNL